MMAGQDVNSLSHSGASCGNHSLIKLCTAGIWQLLVRALEQVVAPIRLKERASSR